MPSTSIYAIATLDTKGEEILYLAECARQAGAQVVVVDVSLRAAAWPGSDIRREQVARLHPHGEAFVLGHEEKAPALEAMSEALRLYLVSEFKAGRVSGVVGLGGSTGSALIAPALRALPIGLPKVLVSTMASGFTTPYVGASDIFMVFPVVDIAGLNFLSRRVLANAAASMAGMALDARVVEPSGRPAAGMTMFGSTTPCVTAVLAGVQRLGWEGLVFHATGLGGQTMEKMVDEGYLQAVLDITNTEIADEVVGGIFTAGQGRLDASIRAGLPMVLGLGAMDMVNFGPLDSVPSRFRKRRLWAHTPHITLMRTDVEENRKCARWLARKLNRAHGPCVILAPEKGLSTLDAPGKEFHDPEADRVLFDELEATLVPTENRRLKRLPLHINDPAFAEEVVNTFAAIAPSALLVRGQPAASGHAEIAHSARAHRAG